MTIRTGSCLCGAARFQVQGDFDAFFLCHCQRCKKDTGSAHGANLFSRTAQLAWQQGEDAVTHYTLPGSRHGKSFCKHCGSALPGTQLEGTLLVVPAGSLDSEVTVRPTAHLFTASKACWENAMDDIPGYEGLPPSA